MIESNPVITRYDQTSITTVQQELQIIDRALSKGYETPFGALVAPSDIYARQQIKTLAATLEKRNPKMIVLVGIGGSNIGACAVAQALGTKRDLLCADTIDDRATQKLLTKFRTRLAQGDRGIVCIVTKSGTTSETIINGSLFLEVLKEYHPKDYKQYVVAITDHGSPLYITALKEGFHILEIPKLVGGRYSVFTAVGLLPLSLLGIDIDQFCDGAQQAIRTCVDESFEVNEAAQSALTLYTHYRQGYTNHNLFVFSPYLVECAHWYKQLIGESLGKKTDTSGKLVEVGFTPIVSLGTTDLHSVAQLYLAGPRNIMTSFFIFDDESDQLQIPANSISKLVPGMAGRSLTSVKSAIVQGTITAFKKQERPSLVTHLTQTSASLGSLFILKMVETILLGRLLNIDPFDQPAVELYKNETRNLLKSTEL